MSLIDLAWIIGTFSAVYIPFFRNTGLNEAPVTHAQPAECISYDWS